MKQPCVACPVTEDKGIRHGFFISFDDELEQPFVHVVFDGEDIDAWITQAVSLIHV